MKKKTFIVILRFRKRSLPIGHHQSVHEKGILYHFIALTSWLCVWRKILIRMYKMLLCRVYYITTIGSNNRVTLKSNERSCCGWLVVAVAVRRCNPVSVLFFCLGMDSSCVQGTSIYCCVTLSNQRKTPPPPTTYIQQDRRSTASQDFSFKGYQQPRATSIDPWLDK